MTLETQTHRYLAARRIRLPGGYFAATIRLNETVTNAPAGLIETGGLPRCSREAAPRGFG